MMHGAYSVKVPVTFQEPHIKIDMEELHYKKHEVI